MGSYCRRFTFSLYKECGIFPPPDLMQEFVECKSVEEGNTILERIGAYQREIGRKP